MFKIGIIGSGVEDSCSQVTTQSFLKNATTPSSVTIGVRIF